MLTDLDSFIGLPRLTGLRLAPDGRRLVSGGVPWHRPELLG